MSWGEGWGSDDFVSCDLLSLTALRLSRSNRTVHIPRLPIDGWGSKRTFLEANKWLTSPGVTS